MRTAADSPVTNRTFVALGIEHLEAAVRYGQLGKRAFFADKSPIVFVAVESELRKAYESLNKLGPTARRAHPTLPFDRMAEIRRVLTHDYAGVDREDVQKMVTQEAPSLLRQLSKLKLPKEGATAPTTP
ncbi:MAG: DUF86 domain-containing protein [Thermoplasmata archaeon]|nr:DUF86 domain-containing protein [Thermoplasmata archaeon]